MWNLKGIYKEKPYEQWAMDIEYLKSFLTMILRNGGTGFIHREHKLQEVER
jgi:FMN-dependent NADH-azoreductase